jgi:soluble lytic murein transglycosylase-like protein
MAACKVDLRDLVTAEAQRQGVDPAIALSVAKTESGICQWRADGSVVLSPVGAIGVFQLMPATAAGLGVDPYDVNGNIQGGITFLKQLFQKYGSWDQALAAYNWGPAKVDRATAAGTGWPGEVVNYVKGVLGIGALYNAGAQQKSSPSTPAPLQASILPVDTILSSVVSAPASVKWGAVLVLGGVGIAIYLLDD